MNTPLAIRRAEISSVRHSAQPIESRVVKRFNRIAHIIPKMRESSTVKRSSIGQPAANDAASAVHKLAGVESASEQQAAQKDAKQRRQIQETASLLSAIVESSDDAIISKTLAGIITSWNKGAERLFGYTADEAIGQPITIVIPQNRLAEEPEIIRRIQVGERVEHLETIRRRKDGTLLDISLTISPIRNDDGTIVGASKIATISPTANAARRSNCSCSGR